MEENRKKVTPLGQFNCQSFPIDETNCYLISEEELNRLGNDLQWDYDNDTEEQILNEKTNEYETKIIKHPKLVPYDNSKELKREYALNRISELKSLLFESDYRAIKYAEGLYTEEEYAPYKTQRQEYRDEINRLEKELEG